MQLAADVFPRKFLDSFGAEGIEIIGLAAGDEPVINMG
jgi:hypothetical protein